MLGCQRSVGVQGEDAVPIGSGRLVAGCRVGRRVDACACVGGGGFEAPWIFPDEVTYALLGRSLWDPGSLSLLGDAMGGTRSFIRP